MKRRPCHIRWQESANFDRYPWPRKGVVWLAGVMVENESGIELMTLYPGENAVTFYTIEKGEFNPYDFKRWAMVKPPYNPNY